MGRARLIIGALLALSAGAATAHPPRSHAAIASFKRQQPCPATGARHGRCPGYVIDHVRPLCAGGADAPSNMQWQTVRDAKNKDRTERVECRRR